MAPPFSPSPTIDLLPNFQKILPQLTRAIVEALMPEFRNQVLRPIPVLLNGLLADTLMHRIRNEIQRMMPIMVLEMVRNLVRFKGENYEADTGNTDDEVTTEGGSKSSGHPKTPGVKYSDVRVSDDEMIARFNEAKRKQAVMQTKDVKNAGVAVEVLFEQGKDGIYTGTQGKGAVKWMGKEE